MAPLENIQPTRIIAPIAIIGTNELYDGLYNANSNVLATRRKLEEVTTGLYAVDNTLRVAVIGGTYENDVLSVQPTGSILGQKFITSTYLYQYIPDANSQNVWIRFGLDILNRALTGYTIGTGTPTAINPIIDTVLTSLGKLENRGLANTTNKQDTLVSATNIKSINGSSILGAGDLTVTGITDATLASTITGATSKAIPVDNDEIGITDSASSFSLKKLTWANLKAALSNLFLNKSGDIITGNIGNTSTGFFRVASGSTALRPVTPLDGMIRYNTDPSILRNEFYSNGAWRNMARLEGDTLTGTAGAGFIGYIAQSTAPSTPTDGFRFYADASNRFAWKGTNGFTRTFDGISNTADRVYTLPDTSGTIALVSDTAKLTGATFTGAISATNLSNSNTGDVTVTTIGSTPNANGITILGQQIQLQPANATNGGILTSSGFQNIGGTKIFQGGIVLDYVTLQFRQPSGNFYANMSPNLFGPTALTANRSYVLPDANGTIALAESNVATATRLQTARTINGQPFDGTQNIASDTSKLSRSGDTITGDISNTSTGFFRIASGSNAARPVTPLDGMIRYNTDTLRTEFYSNSAWRNMARLEGDTLTGTAGTGFIGYISQSTAPSTPISGFRFYADASSRFAWKGTNGFTRTFDGISNTADRVYTLPNADGTIALVSDIPSSITGNAGTATILQTARTINGVSFNGSANITIGNPTILATTPITDTTGNRISFTANKDWDGQTSVNATAFTNTGSAGAFETSGGLPVGIRGVEIRIEYLAGATVPTFPSYVAIVSGNNLIANITNILYFRYVKADRIDLSIVQ